MEALTRALSKQLNFEEVDIFDMDPPDSDPEMDCECGTCQEWDSFDTKLASLFGWERCPSGDLDFFLDPEDYKLCDDPLHCCHEDYLYSLGDEVHTFGTSPEVLALSHTVSNGTMWDDGWSKPVAPPFRLAGHTYMAFRPGEIMHRCIEKVACSWDVSLPLNFKITETTFQAESANPGNPEITTEEQGTNVPTGPTPSASSMATLATAATGAIESEWKLFFAYHTTMNWSTRDGSGKVLFVQNLSPKLNPYLKHISQLYTGWSGGIDIRFTVSGSGVFGGKLAAVVVPPGIDPTGGISLLQFPHVLFDARQTEPVIFSIPDIRKSLWHEMDDNDTSSLVIVVYNELINPYQHGNDSTDCTITVETRPSADFQFNLLKPPSRVLKAGKEPSDLIPKNSLLWEGNRLPGNIVTFAINPTIGQANRHFDSNRFTSGWSSPKHSEILCRIRGTTGDKVHELDVGDSHMLVPGVPDGWPDYTSNEAWPVQASITKYDDYPYGIVCACLPYTYTNQGNGGYIAKHVVVGVGVKTPQTVNADHTIWQNTLKLIDPDTQAAGTKLKLRPMMIVRRGVNGRPYGDTLDQVCRYDRLPTASTLNGNYPLYFVSNFMCNYGQNGIQVYNSQILHTSASFASDSYNIGPDSFAVYRIKDSAGRWFDIGIAANGFAYVGSFVLNFNILQAPYTASYMGIQSNGNPLAHNVEAGAQRTI